MTKDNSMISVLLSIDPNLVFGIVYPQSDHNLAGYCKIDTRNIVKRHCSRSIYAKCRCNFFRHRICLYIHLDFERIFY